MSRRTPATVLGVTLALTAGATAVLAGGGGDPVQHARAAALQRTLGGLGAGTALDLRTCAVAFDPRLEATCRCRVDPVAGGGSYCRGHRGLLAVR
ncbi:MAG: hypothetical protein IT460_04315 [Planctomycetes bacterium]|nr:hypothetical protein [Planctomycetota bacterium]